MTLGEDVMGGARTRAERVRSRKTQHRKPLGNRRIPGRQTLPRRRTNHQRFETAISLERKTRLRLPSIRLMGTGARIPALILLAISAWACMSIYSAPDFKVTHPVVSGIQYMSPSRIRTIAGTNGAHIFEVDPAEIESRLEAHPEVESAEVQVQWPNQVLIEIEERLPILAWDDAGQTWMLSADGLAFFGRGVVPELIQVHSLTPALNIGEPLEAVIEKEKIKAVYDLSILVGQDKQLMYDQRYGFGFRDERGWMAYFGTSGEMSAKYQVYNEIAQDLAQQAYPAMMVSVEDLAAPFYH